MLKVSVRPRELKWRDTFSFCRTNYQSKIGNGFTPHKKTPAILGQRCDVLKSFMDYFSALPLILRRRDFEAVSKSFRLSATDSESVPK